MGWKVWQVSEKAGQMNGFSGPFAEMAGSRVKVLTAYLLYLSR